MFLNNIENLKHLKNEYRRLAKILHPDVGGDTEDMKKLNNEFDLLFAIFKRKSSSKETAQVVREEFYTQNGWKGKNYSNKLRTKDIAKIIREYVKEEYSDCKFSVTIDLYSMGSSIYVALMEAPQDLFQCPPRDGFRFAQSADHYCDETIYHNENNIVLTDYAKKIILDVQNLIDSYRFNDSDSSIDYFNTNFYYHINIGKWDKEFSVVERGKKATKKATC